MYSLARIFWEPYNESSVIMQLIFSCIILVFLTACGTSMGKQTMFNNEVQKPKQLKLANYQDPILRHKTKIVTFPLSKSDQQTISDMLYSISPEQLPTPGAGMAANQWGIDKQIFIYAPNGNDKIEQIEVIINPSYISADANQEVQDDAWEGCFSIPLTAGKIRRYTNIHVKYQNQQGKVIERELSGWDARVWQHENDHLNGILYDDPSTGKCLEKKVFASAQELGEFFASIRAEREKSKNKDRSPQNQPNEA